MAKFRGSAGAKFGNLFAEGTYIFKITGVDFDDQSDIVTVVFTTENKETFKEKFFLRKNNGEENSFKIDQLLRVLMFALDVDGLKTLDTDSLPELKGHYIKAKVIHEVYEGKKRAKTDPFAYETVSGFKEKSGKKVVIPKAIHNADDDDSILDDDDDDFFDDDDDE